MVTLQAGKGVSKKTIDIMITDYRKQYSPKNIQMSRNNAKNIPKTTHKTQDKPTQKRQTPKKAL